MKILKQFPATTFFSLLAVLFIIVFTLPAEAKNSYAAPEFTQSSPQ